MDVKSITKSKEFERQLPEKRITTWKEFLIPFRDHGHIRILAVGSSLREGSYSTLAAKMALDLSTNANEFS